jgi:hypothetical protein
MIGYQGHRIKIVCIWEVRVMNRLSSTLEIGIISHAATKKIGRTKVTERIYQQGDPDFTFGTV